MQKEYKKKKCDEKQVKKKKKVQRQRGMDNRKRQDEGK